MKKNMNKSNMLPGRRSNTAGEFGRRIAAALHQTGPVVPLVGLLTILPGMALATTTLDDAVWQSSRNRLVVKGGADRGVEITVVNAYQQTQSLGTDDANRRSIWRLKVNNPTPSVPCRVAAFQNGSEIAQLDVRNAPADCAPKAPPGPDPDPNPSDVSINSTSQNGVLGNPVPEQPLTGQSGYALFAVNDLGMHCGDLDTRISSILPPFNVLHATLIKKGEEPDVQKPSDGISLVYSAASNPNDPILSGLNSAGTGPVYSSVVNGSVFKTNFWDVARDAYAPFYPPGILAAFYPQNENILDKGLPMPDVERLYLGDGVLAADQQSMPGRFGPYVLNEPNEFPLFVGDQAFFINPAFKFGYVSEAVNWFEAAGIPLTTFDDHGRENPWPLYRVQALNASGDVLASLDTVVPISGEANCGFCHNAIEDGGNGAATEALGSNVALTIDDPQEGFLPLEVSKEYAADLNILRLHDQKHNTTLEADKPVVCQTCHYTPALDLAQVGPRGPENDVAPGDPSNGRDQVKNKSMSNVMHGHHADVTDGNGNRLFPDMPPPVDGSGNLRDPIAANTILQETCYQCHPGRRTDCLRGAMAAGGMLCQDCHGDMNQVGDDFTRTVSSGSVGSFELGGDFYTNPDQPRVPWANEPGCGSCHTGDAMDNLRGTPGTLAAPDDSVRLIQAYLAGDPKATPIVPVNKRFAENVIEAENLAVSGPDDPRIGNPMLYRVSKGHEDVFCEACHGATHGIWPNSKVNANDNVAAMQLQGHTGTISECSTCHDPSAFEDSGELELTMEGPHGLHAVGSRLWNEKHKEAGKNRGDDCRACHGVNGEGTVLSRMFTDRILECKDNKGGFCSDEGPKLFPKGHQVGCADCHEDGLSELDEH